MKGILVVLLALFFAIPVLADEPSDRLIAALIRKESGSEKRPGGDDNAIGDKKLRHKAYGCLQIRKPCVDDVNRHYGTKYRAEDCLGNRELSIKICKMYIDTYATSDRLGRKPTDQDKARIWNGGPCGWKRKSTLSYWARVKELL